MPVVAAFYKFTPFPDPAALKPGLAKVACAQGVTGSILLAREGINGTIAGDRAGIDTVLAHIRRLPGCANLDWQESHAGAAPFNRMKVRIKREIVTMGQTEVDPTAAVGRYVDPADWNALIAAPDVAVIDTRNDYEVAIGSFEGADDPGTQSFGDFPAWWQANGQRFAGRRIAMFCTGGIRCEKATSYLLGQGVAEVFHLRGGILSYLNSVPQAQSLWHGECYVFDQRVSVGPGLAPGRYTSCHACGRPVSPEAKTDPAYEEGVQCPACVGEYGPADRARFRERQRQFVRDEARKTG
ncbi:MAG: rhodanese-related sulfurtransferase [Rhodobacter sp.]|nr:rhodanese-related sulfurtransferase [Rhodobacter sp.]